MMAMNAEERRLLLDLVTAALGALQTSEKIANRVKAVELILRRKSILTGDEINRRAGLYIRQKSQSDGRGGRRISWHCHEISSEFRGAQIPPRNSRVVRPSVFTSVFRGRSVI